MISKGRGFFRTVFFLPVLLGTGYIMQQLLGTGAGDVVTNSVDGIVTGVLMKAIGATFAGYVQIFLSTITVVLWKSGVQIILFLAGLQGIGASLYEAARCDGATEWENFWKITLPIVSPIILLNFVYSMIDSLQIQVMQSFQTLTMLFLTRHSLISVLQWLDVLRIYIGSVWYCTYNHEKTYI